jgi:hypothetical protein
VDANASQVCEEFSLLRQTFYLALNLVDRYLSMTQGLTKDKYQLVGLCGLLVASKLEVSWSASSTTLLRSLFNTFQEYYPPTLKDFIVLCDGAWTKYHLIDMELDMLLVCKPCHLLCGSDIE